MATAAARPPRYRFRVRFDRQHGFRFFHPCPTFTIADLPEGSRIVIPPDGGFWVVDRATGIRYRRLTMDDLPKGVTWNTRGKAEE